jgi:hypothetical protein
MTFATHLERQFMLALRPAGWSKRVFCLRARDSCKRCCKRLDRNNKIRPEKRGPLSADRRGFGG